VRELPEGLPETGVVAGVVEGWGLDVASARYLPVGFGSYHWDVTDADGCRHFVTVDDLDHKGWLGHDRDSTFDGLRAAFDTALALRRDGGLAFVVAPAPARDGGTVRRLDARYAASLFPFVDGAGGRFAAESTPAERAAVVRLLAELHAATPVARPFARRRHLDLPRRRDLEAALHELDRAWTGGPLSEAVRELLAGHAAVVAGRLREFDRLAAEVGAADADLVVTHGEPHGGNALTAGGRPLLVDWDTVGLAPPERDLWHVTADPDELAVYTEVSGRPVNPTAIALYRLRWELDDISVFARELRSPHGRTADTEKALFGLRSYLRPGDGGA
jgi:spectinomycin phosphotransferase